MTVIIQESGGATGGTYPVTITAVSPKIMGKVDGSDVAVPMFRPAGLAVNVGDRLTAQLRPPQPPLLQSSEVGA